MTKNLGASFLRALFPGALSEERLSQERCSKTGVTKALFPSALLPSALVQQRVVQNDRTSTNPAKTFRNQFLTSKAMRGKRKCPATSSITFTWQV